MSNNNKPGKSESDKYFLKMKIGLLAILLITLIQIIIGLYLLFDPSASSCL